MTSSPVLRHRPPHDLCQRDGPPHEWHGVEEEDAGYVEEQVAERDLQGGLELVAVGGEGGQQTGRGRADVGAWEGRYRACHDEWQLKLVFSFPLYVQSPSQ